jgi:hypothetical protein
MLSRKIFGSTMRFVKCGGLIVCAALSPWAQGQTSQHTNSETLPASQLVQPADFAGELASASDARPTIVYVGFRTLFAGGHIPGATHGVRALHARNDTSGGSA